MTPQERLENLTKSIEETKEHIQSIRKLGDSKLISAEELWLDAQEYARDKLVQEIAEEKRMNVKSTLWDAVEHNNQIELLLTSLEERFKELKQKGYKMNVNVQEKLKEIDKQINTLLEEQEETKKVETSPNIKLFKQYHRQLEKLRNEIEEKDYDVETIEKKVNSIFDLYGYPLGLGSSKRVKTDLFSVYKTK